LRFSSWNPVRFTDESLRFVNRANNASSIEFKDSQVGDYSVERAYDNVFFADGEGGLRRDAQGNILIDNTGQGNLSLNTTSNTNALAKVIERERTKNQTTARANASIEAKLAKGLKFKQSVMGRFRNTVNRDFRGPLHNRNGASVARRRLQDSKRLFYGVESLLTYKRDFGSHSVNAVGGFSYENTDYIFTDIDAVGFDNEFTQNISVAPINDIGQTLLAEDRLISYFGRVNYDYDDRYLLTLTARTDGSSRFGVNSKFGTFPAASVGWRVSNESFLADSDIVSELKVRASYGLSGTNNISRSLTADSFYRSLNVLRNSFYNGSVGVENTTLPQPNLGWEGLREFNPGIDLELFNGAFGMSLDYYKRVSDDLILDLPVPTTLGVPTQIQNIGEVENEGYELELRGRIIDTKDFKWSANAILSTNENTVTDFGNQDRLISFITENKRATEFITEVGLPVSNFYGYVYEGEVPIENIASPFSIQHSQPERVFVKDINGDGLIDEDDRTKLGDPFPDFQWSFSNTFEYKNFDMSFMFQGSHGAQVRVSDFEFLKNEFSGRVRFESGTPDEIVDRTERRIFTSDAIRDAGFVALRNIGIGYTIPTSVTSKLNISRLRIYATGENLLYLTDDGYFGFNPEGQSRTSSNANTGVTLGYQRGENPIAKTFTFGLNLQF